MPIIQNFSIPAGDSQTIEFDITSETIQQATLVGATVFWEVYEQVNGLPVPDVDPVIRKTSLSGGGIQILPDSQPLTFYVFVDPEDTDALARNYYHEAKVYDSTGNPISITYGIMTVNPIQIRETV